MRLLLERSRFAYAGRPLMRAARTRRTRAARAARRSAILSKVWFGIGLVAMLASMATGVLIFANMPNGILGAPETVAFVYVPAVLFIVPPLLAWIAAANARWN